MSDFPVIDTPRLLLREIVPADAPALLAIHGNAQAMQWFGTESMTTMTQAAHLVDVFAGWRSASTGVRWGLQRKSDGVFIGTCGLFKWNRSWKTCITGYELARSAWGSGFMSEAMTAILMWGREHMELERVEAQIHPENIASVRLARKLGFVYEGCLREAGFWQGQRHDLLQFGLLMRESPVFRSAQ